jgi:hypothetical protein
MSTLTLEPPDYSDATMPTPPDNATQKRQRILIEPVGRNLTSVYDLGMDLARS